MALQVEDMHHALPNGLAGSYLFKGKRIDKHDLSAVLAFNGSLELVYAYVHDLPHPIRNVSGIPVNRARGKPSSAAITVTSRDSSLSAEEKRNLRKCFERQRGRFARRIQQGFDPSRKTLR